MNNEYNDIINMQHPISKKHTPMPLEMRAAQFGAFAALAGFEDKVEEVEKIINEKFI